MSKKILSLTIIFTLSLSNIPAYASNTTNTSAAKTTTACTDTQKQLLIDSLEGADFEGIEYYISLFGKYSNQDINELTAKQILDYIDLYGSYTGKDLISELKLEKVSENIDSFSDVTGFLDILYEAEDYYSMIDATNNANKADNTNIPDSNNSDTKAENSNNNSIESEADNNNSNSDIPDSDKSEENTTNSNSDINDKNSSINNSNTNDSDSNLDDEDLKDDNNDYNHESNYDDDSNLNHNDSNHHKNDNESNHTNSDKNKPAIPDSDILDPDVHKNWNDQELNYDSFTYDNNILEQFLLFFRNCFCQYLTGIITNQDIINYIQSNDYSKIQSILEKSSIKNTMSQVPSLNNNHASTDSKPSIPYTNQNTNNDQNTFDTNNIAGQNEGNKLQNEFSNNTPLNANNIKNNNTVIAIPDTEKTKEETKHISNSKDTATSSDSSNLLIFILCTILSALGLKHKKIFNK